MSFTLILTIFRQTAYNSAFSMKYLLDFFAMNTDITSHVLTDCHKKNYFKLRKVNDIQYKKVTFSTWKNHAFGGRGRIS